MFVPGLSFFHPAPLFVPWSQGPVQWCPTPPPLPIRSIGTTSPSTPSHLSPTRKKVAARKGRQRNGGGKGQTPLAQGFSRLRLNRPSRLSRPNQWCLLPSPGGEGGVCVPRGDGAGQNEEEREGAPLGLRPAALGWGGRTGAENSPHKTNHHERTGARDRRENDAGVKGPFTSGPRGLVVTAINSLWKTKT